MTVQELINKLDSLERAEVLDFLESEEGDRALTENGLGISYDSDDQDDTHEEMAAFEEAAVWTFFGTGTFFHVYDINKAQEILAAN